MDDDWRALAHAESLMDLRRYTEAEAAFRDVLARTPDSVPALLGLGRALNHQERNEEAEPVVRSAVALAPEDEGGYHVLADVLCDRRDGPGALAAAESGLRLAPYDFTSHYQYSRALLSQRRPRVRDAYGAALRAVDLQPHNADGHNLVGICLDALGDRPAAQTAFRNALAIDPMHTLAQNNLAATELDSGRLRRAAGMLRAAVGNDPQEKRLHENLDVVLLILGRRILWSLFAAAVVLGILLVNEAPWWARAISGTAYVVVVTLVVRPMREHLPRGVGQWGRGIWHRAQWRGKYLIGMLALLSACVLLLSLAPYEVAAGAGIVLATTLRVLGAGFVLWWIGSAAVNLVRGK